MDQSSSLGPETGQTPSPRSPNTGFDVRMSSEEMLSHVCDWNLACDTAVLNRLKDYSQNMLKRAEAIKHDCNSCVNQVELLQTQVQSITNQFLILSNDQFVENCVEEFEETNSKEATNSPLVHQVKTKAEKEAELIMKMKESIQIGIQANARTDYASSQPQIRTAHIIGTPKFFSSRYCGLIDESYRERPIPDLQENVINSEDLANQPCSLDETLTNYISVPNTSKAQSSVDSDYQFGGSEYAHSQPPKSEHSLSSEDNFLGFTKTPLTSSSNSLSTTHSHDTDLKKPNDIPPARGPISIMDDLNKVLRARMPPPPPADSDSEDDFKPQASGRNLFADLDDNDDIFDTKPVQPDLVIKEEKVQHTNNIFKPPTNPAINSIADLIRSQPVPEKLKEAQRQSVFADSDSDSDMISSTSSNTSSKKTAVAKVKVDSSPQRKPENNFINKELPSAQKDLPVKTNKAPEALPQNGLKTLKTELVHDDKAFTPAITKTTVQPRGNPPKLKDIGKKSRFEESDSDDDLFSSKSSFTKSSDFSSKPFSNNIFTGNSSHPHSSSLFGDDESDIFPTFPTNQKTSAESSNKNDIFGDSKSDNIGDVANVDPEKEIPVQTGKNPLNTLFNVQPSGAGPANKGLFSSSSNAEVNSVSSNLPKNVASSLVSPAEDVNASTVSEPEIEKKTLPRADNDSLGASENNEATSTSSIDTSANITTQAARSIIAKTLVIRAPGTKIEKKLTSPTAIISPTSATSSAEPHFFVASQPTSTLTSPVFEEPPSTFDSPPTSTKLLESLAKGRPKISIARRKPTKKPFTSNDLIIDANNERSAALQNGFEEDGYPQEKSTEKVQTEKVSSPSVPIIPEPELKHADADKVIDSKTFTIPEITTPKEAENNNKAAGNVATIQRGTESTSSTSAISNGPPKTEVAVNSNQVAASVEKSRANATSEKQIKQSIFDDADSDSDDIFSSVKPKKSQANVVIDSGPAKRQNENQNVVINQKQKAEHVNRSKPKSVFAESESDDDGDLFASNKSIPASSTMLKNGPDFYGNISNGQSFSKEEASSGSRNIPSEASSSAKLETAKSTPSNKKQSAKPQQKSIFDDSDSDSDIFKPKSKLF